MVKFCLDQKGLLGPRDQVLLKCLLYHMSGATIVKANSLQKELLRKSSLKFLKHFMFQLEEIREFLQNIWYQKEATDVSDNILEELRPN